MAVSHAFLSGQGEVIVKAPCRPCDEREGGLTSFGTLEGQTVELKWASPLASPILRSLHPMAMTPPQPARISKEGQAMSTEGLWQEFFSDPSQWWDNVFDKKNLKSPDLSVKRTKEVLWIEGCSAFPWVDAELAALMQGQEHADTAKIKGQQRAPGQENNGMARLNQAQWFVGHQTGGRGSTHTIPTASERGPREGVNKDSSGTCGDLRTLCKAGRLKEALHILNQQDIQADSDTYACLFQECINVRGLAEGKQVHANLIQTGFKPNIFLFNTLVKMYANCGSVVDARQVFDKMLERDMFTWNIMIAGYAKHGDLREAFEIYRRMQQEGVTPDRVTFICVLNACASVGALEKGKEVHAEIIKTNNAPYINLENTLVNMYAKCGSIKDARQVFDKMVERDVVSWNAIIGGYAQYGYAREAFEMYERMQEKGVIPDQVTFICILSACASMGSLDKVKEVHAAIIKTGITSYMNLENTLVNMYAKCGSMNDARQLFDNMAQRDLVSWSAMIAGYAEHGCGREAFNIYEQMRQDGVRPDRITFTSVLSACASLGALEKGKEVHDDIIKTGIVLDIILETALADMYARCGSLKDARRVFNGMAKRNVVSWNGMIAGYSQHGCSREALQLFEKMQQEGLKPNGVTFTSVLSACSHVGLVDEGCHYFDSMSFYHGLTPTAEHFGCMVDLLGRAGQLDEAQDFIEKMPVEPDASVWGALLGACRIRGNVELAEHASKCLLKCDPQHAATYVPLSNIYAVAGRWDDRAIERRCENDGGG